MHQKPFMILSRPQKLKISLCVKYIRNLLGLLKWPSKHVGEASILFESHTRPKRWAQTTWRSIAGWTIMPRRALSKRFPRMSYRWKNCIRTHTKKLQMESKLFWVKLTPTLHAMKLYSECMRLLDTSCARLLHSVTKLALRSESSLLARTYKTL
mgnify:CR=1 FL=1